MHQLQVLGALAQVRVLILAQTPRVSSVAISVLPPALPVRLLQQPSCPPAHLYFSAALRQKRHLVLTQPFTHPKISLFPFFSRFSQSPTPFDPPLETSTPTETYPTKKISHLPHPNIHRLPSSPSTLLFFTTPSFSTGPAFGASRYLSERHHLPHFNFEFFAYLSIPSWRLSSAARRSEPAAPVFAVAKARRSAFTRMVGRLVETARRVCTTAIYPRRALRIITASRLLDPRDRERVCLASEACLLPATANLLPPVPSCSATCKPTARNLIRNW